MVAQYLFTFLCDWIHEDCSWLIAWWMIVNYFFFQEMCLWLLRIECNIADLLKMRSWCSQGLLGVLRDSSRGLLGVLRDSSRVYSESSETVLEVYLESSETVLEVYSKFSEPLPRSSPRASSRSLHRVRGSYYGRTQSRSRSQYSEFLGGAAQKN